MRVFPFCLLLGLAAAIASAQTGSQNPTSKLSTPNIAFEKYKLRNGLEVILHEDHRLPLVAFDIWYHVGPLNEVRGRTGFAHLFEHMMFEGSEHVGEKAHFKFLEGAGATDINGTTDFDRTNYFETLPSNQLELGLWLESDRMGFLLEKLDRARLTNQRDVVRNERRQGEGQPYELAEEEMYHLLFSKDHPYYADVIGSHEDIEAARLLDVRDFHQHFYTPNNATLAIAGDFKTAELKPMLDKYFGPIPAGPAPQKVQVKTSPITTEKRSTVTDDVKLPRVTVAWITAPAFQDGNAETQIMMQVLGGGTSSRLYQRLVYEKQMAQQVNCGTTSLALGSVAVCNVTARPGVKPEDLEAEMNQQIERLRNEGPAVAELNRARNRILTSKITALQRLGGFGGVADTLNEYNQYVGDPGFLGKDVARFQAASVDSVKAIAEKKFAKSERVTVYTVTGKKVLNDVPRSPDSTDAEVKVVNPYSEAFEKEQDWRNAAPVPGPTPKLSLPVPAVFTLENGLKVYLAEEHALPVATTSVIVFAGSDANPADRPGLASYTARMLRQGTERRSATQLANDVADLGTTITSGANEDAASTGIGGLSNNLDTALDILSDALQHPAFKQEEVERVRGERLAAIVQEADNPVQTVLRVGQRAVYGNGPYAYPASGTPQSVKAISANDVAGFWSAHYGPRNAALVITGDVTPERAKQLVQRFFGSWSNPNATAAPGVPEAPAEVKPRVVIVDKPGAPQTALIAFGVGVARKVPDYAADEVMNDILGGLFSSRINMNLRERNGYTYGGFSFFNQHRGPGPLLAGALVRTDVTAPAASELFKELRGITTETPSGAEIQLAKNYSLQSLTGRFETVGTTSMLIGDLFTYDLPTDYYRKLPAQFDSVTAQDVGSAAQKHVRANEMVLVAVGDRAKIQPGLEKLGIGPVEIRDPQGNLITK